MSRATRVVRSSVRQALISMWGNMYTELQAEAEAIGLEGVAQFDKVVRGWDTKVRFTYERKVTAQYISVEIKPYGKNAIIFTYVDQGTKPHIIRSKGDYPLRFQTGYSALTKPVAQYGVGTGQSSGEWISKYEVNHPGTKARQFTETYMRDIKAELARRIENALRRGARRAT